MSRLADCGVRFHFRLDSLSPAGGPALGPLLQPQVVYLLYFSPYFTFCHTHPPSSYLATMPPTGDYPPHKLSVKLPRASIASISSLTKTGRNQTISAETRRRLLETDRRWRAKCILRAISVVFSLIGFSLFAAAVPKWDSDFYWGGGPNSGDWEDGFPIAVVRTLVHISKMRWPRLTDSQACIRIPLQYRYDLPDAAAQDFCQAIHPSDRRFSRLGSPCSCHHFLSRSGSVRVLAE